MSTAGYVPPTRELEADELEGDEALETLRRVGRRRLAIDAFQRFRAADGFSHSRALGFQLTLTLLPAVIAVVGFAAALDQASFTRVVQATIDDIAPGAAGDLLTAALRQGTRRSQEAGEEALAAGLLAALIAGTTAMGQLERGSNRIYGVERDRPPVRKYSVAAALACTAGTSTVLAFVVLVGGDALRRAVGWGETPESVWVVARWPLGLALLSALMWLAFTGLAAVSRQEARARSG